MNDLIDVANELDVVLAELDCTQAGLSYLIDKLFGASAPVSEYQDDYKQLQALFRLLDKNLTCTLGRFGLIMGDDAAHYVEAEKDEIAALSSIGDWWLDSWKKGGKGNVNHQTHPEGRIKSI